MKYLLNLAYKGTNYQGWQRQKNGLGVQAVLEEALAKMLGQKVNCVGCGRTDAGVHASQYFCHFVVEKSYDFDPVFRLNKMLPPDIRIYNCRPVDRHFHAQKDAVSRTYRYQIHFQEDPFLHDISTFLPLEDLNMEAMQDATKLLTQHTDFQAFCKQPNLYKSTECQVSTASLKYDQPTQRLYFEITADRFLKGMVRLIVGNLLEVGYGQLSLEAFHSCLSEKKRPPYFKMAYPQGLYLARVEYKAVDLLSGLH